MFWPSTSSNYEHFNNTTMNSIFLLEKKEQKMKKKKKHENSCNNTNDHLFACFRSRASVDIHFSFDKVSVCM